MQQNFTLHLFLILSKFVISSDLSFESSAQLLLAIPLIMFQHFLSNYSVQVTFIQEN